MNLFTELKRRNVLKVASVYVADYKKLVMDICFPRFKLMYKHTCTIFAFLLISKLSFADENSFKEAWKFAELYKNEQGNYLNLSGRLHLDSAWFNADQGEYQDLSWRRFRFGFKGKYGHFYGALEADIDLNKSFSEAYNRLTDANIAWNIGNQLKITVLKQSAGFTLDGKTSSKKLLTPQRNNLTNNLWFTSEYFTGVSAKGSFSEDYDYNIGIYSSDDSDEIGFTEASYFSLLSFGTRLTSNSYWQDAQIRFDYVYNDVHEKGNTRDFAHVMSFSSKFTFGDWHLWNDIAMGQGDLGQSDVWGLVVMPYYQQSTNVQWVMRYTYLDSEDVNGLRLGRYEKNIVEGRGDNYREYSAGVNYLFNSHKFKIHLGGQYTKMADQALDGGKYNGWGITLALRSYW